MASMTAAGAGEDKVEKAKDDEQKEEEEEEEETPVILQISS